MTLVLTSPAFRNGDRIPLKHTCTGRDVSPPLAWSGVPDGCLSLVVTCDDPDAPAGIWHHWALFDIPPDWSSLEEGLPPEERIGALRQGVNDFRKLGYAGPCPPPGDGAHRYHFKLLALDVDRLDLPHRPTCRNVAAAVKSHRIGEATLIGLYER